MNMSASSKPPAGYLVLLLPSLLIPGLHSLLTARAIEHTRLFTGFLPGHTLLLRWLGEVSYLLPLAAAAFFVLSFHRVWFNRASTLFGFAAVQVGFVTFYAIYC